MSASLATRRFVAAFLAAGALVGAAALPASADDHRRDRDHRAAHSSIVISDVQYGTGGRDRDRSDRALNREWVEVENTGRRSVNLRGFTLTDRQGNRYRFGDFRLDGGPACGSTPARVATPATTSTRTAATRSGTSATPPPCATTVATSSTPTPGTAAGTTATADPDGSPA